jgi:hypothetical protein
LALDGLILLICLRIKIVVQAAELTNWQNRRDIFCSMFIRDLIGGLINLPFLCSVLAINSPVYALKSFE